MPPAGIELLSPAGDLSSFYAAVHNGADAVYLGASSFGARAGVGFDNEALHALVRYAHLYGKRIYVTLNTLIKQNELPQAEDILRFLDGLEIDAVIVQDLGLMHLIKCNFPKLPVHASTQMSVHNMAGARFLMDQGVNRVVLARECSLDTIHDVASQGIETEVFVHGAQCVSVSGQCLLSSHIGGRSGNRGRCAQPCRTEYEYRGQSGAWLSPRDLAQIDRLGDLVQAGITSLKIEGRLKRPEYVATVTDLYRKALDRYVSEGDSRAPYADRKALLQIFNRGGFTQGWAFGQSDALLINPGRVSHEGLPLGVIRSSRRNGEVILSEIELNDVLHHGDHLQIRGLKDQEMIYSGPSYNPGDKAVIRHYQVAKPGETVFKLTDALQIQQAKESIDSPMPRIPLAAKLLVASGEPAKLMLSSGTACVTTFGDTPQPALSRPMDADNSFRSIQKTAGTPFVIESYAFKAADNCFLPVSSLNELRRRALQRMEDALTDAYQRKPAQSPRFHPSTHIFTETEEPALYVRSERIDLIERFRSLGMRHFLYSPQDYTSDRLTEDCRALSNDDYLCLPRQASDKTLDKLIQMAKEYDLSVMVDNVGQLAAEYPRKLLAGPGIPVWNGQTMQLLRNTGCNAAILSTELSKQETKDLTDVPVIRTILPVYGRAMVMQLNHCPERCFRGLSGSQTGCQLCRAGEGTRGRYLRDRRGAAFPLYPVRLPEGCINALLFHTPVNLFESAIGSHWLLDFTLEKDEIMFSLISAYAGLLSGENTSPSSPVPIYDGRFSEGVL